MPRAESLDDPDWDASLYGGPCTVVAPDERTARRYADSAFCLAVMEPRPGLPPPISPWSQPRLVRAERILEAHLGEALGEVLVPAAQSEGGVRIAARAV
jgi:hypothetical protein